MGVQFDLKGAECVSHGTRKRLFTHGFQAVLSVQPVKKPSFSMVFKSCFDQQPNAFSPDNRAWFAGISVIFNVRIKSVFCPSTLSEYPKIGLMIAPNPKDELYD